MRLQTASLVITGAAVWLALPPIQPASAQVLRESYVARLSAEDHFNSQGVRLTTVAGILRQDRANFHRYGVRDPQDEGDRFFGDAGNRARMEDYILNGRVSPSARNAILYGTPVVVVSVFRMEDGRDYLQVDVQ